MAHTRRPARSAELTMNSPDIIPVFDFRDGADCEHLQFKTWSEMGLRWNSYREMSLSGSSYKPDMLDSLLAECRRIRAQVIAIGLHNCAASVCIKA